MTLIGQYFKRIKRWWDHAKRPACTAGVDYPGLGVGIVLMDNQSRILIHRRAGSVRNEPGMYDLPGGGVDWGPKDRGPDEAISHAILEQNGSLLQETTIREAKEELGVDIHIARLIGLYDHPLLSENPPQYWASACYLGKITEGTPQIMEPHKCDAMEWAGRTRLKQLYDQNVLAGVARQIIGEIISHPQKFQIHAI